MSKSPSYRNRLEKKVAANLGPGFEYEPKRLPYKQIRHYLPDFVNETTKEIVEAKGLFRADDRAKLLAIKDQYPEYSLKIIFQNPDAKLNKTSKTSYGDWCTKHGIQWEKA